MIQEEVFAKVISALEKAGADYMITGSVASIRYGKPRVTHDIDMVIVFKKTQLKKLFEELKDEFNIDEAVVEDMVRSAGMFTLVHSSTGLKLDCWCLKETEYNITSFNRRKKVNFAGTQAYFSTPEDVILSKLLWYKQGASARHFEDIKGIIDMQTELDFRYIEKWVEELGVMDIWNTLIKEK